MLTAMWTGSATASAQHAAAPAGPAANSPAPAADRPVTLRLLSGVRIVGVVVEATDESVTLRTASGLITIPRRQLAPEKVPSPPPAVAAPTPHAQPAGASGPPGTPAAAIAGSPAAAPAMPPADIGSPRAGNTPGGGASSAGEAGLPRHIEEASLYPGAPRFKARFGKFTVPSKLTNNPEITVTFMTPGETGANRSRAAGDVVFYAPFINERDPLRTLENEYLRELTTYHGMTVFSMAFRSEVENTKRRDLMYYYAESGSFEAVMEAWKQLRDELSLPKRNLLVIGNSGGSTMAVGLAAKFPQLIDAVAICGGSHFDAMPAKLRVPILAVVTRGDGRYAENLELLRQARAVGTPFLLGVGPSTAMAPADFAKQHEHNFHHSGNPLSLALLRDFIADVREARERGKAGSDQWQFGVPLRFWDPACGPDAGRPLAAAEDARVPAPGPRFAATWQGNPNRFARVRLPDGGSIPVQIRYPSDQAPKGILIYGGRSADNAVAVGDALDFLGLSGWIAVGALQENGQDMPEAGWAAVVEWARAQANWKQIPLHFVGWEDSARDFLLLAASRPDLSVASVAALDGLLIYPERTRSPLDALRPGMPPVFLGGLGDAYVGSGTVLAFARAAEKHGVACDTIGARRSPIAGLDPALALVLQASFACEQAAPAPEPIASHVPHTHELR